MSVKRYDMKEVFKGRMAVVETSAGAFVTHGDYAVLEQKLTDMAVQLVNAESKCRELAAESSNKSRCLGFFASVIKSGEEWTSVCEHEYSEAFKTPATDAFLAEVRAQARNELLTAFMSDIKRAGLTDGDSVTTFEAHDALKHCIEQLNEEAAK